MFSIERLQPTWGISHPISLFGEFDDLASRLIGEAAVPTAGAQVWLPSSDLVETVDKIQIRIDLPGMTKDNIDIQLNENALVIRGERKFEEQENTKYHRLERFYGNFTRSFVLPSTVEADKISASFKDGVLEVVLPKKE